MRNPATCCISPACALSFLSLPSQLLRDALLYEGRASPQGTHHVAQKSMSATLSSSSSGEVCCRLSVVTSNAGGIGPRASSGRAARCNARERIRPGSRQLGYAIKLGFAASSCYRRARVAASAYSDSVSFRIDCKRCIESSSVSVRKCRFLLRSSLLAAATDRVGNDGLPSGWG